MTLNLKSTYNIIQPKLPHWLPKPPSPFRRSRRSVVSEAPKLHFQLHCMLHLQRSNMATWETMRKSLSFWPWFFFSDFNPDVSEHVLQAKWMSKSAKFIHFPAVGMLVTKARHQGASAYPGKSILTWRAQRLVVESPIPTTILLYIIHIYIFIYIYTYWICTKESTKKHYLDHDFLHEGENQKARFFARRKALKTKLV